jgi:ABC-type glycerol-3-phosphate transport system substrate-binding protein
MKINTLISVISLLLIGAFVLTACAEPISTEVPGVEAPESSPTIKDPAVVITVESPTPTEADLSAIITIWHAWREVEIESLNAVITAFQVANPSVEFDILFTPSDELFEDYQAAVSAGGGPTILIGPAEWGPRLFDAGLIVDLSDMVPDDTLAMINEAVLGSVQYKDALIGLPQAMIGVVLFRNKNIIPKAALTYEEMVVAANEATLGDVTGAILEYGFFFAAPHLRSVCGGELMDAVGNPSFNTDAGICWIEIFKRWQLDFGQLTNYGNEDLELFKAGKAGYIIGSTLKITSLAEAIGVDTLAIDPWPDYGEGQLSGYILSENIYLSVNAVGEDKAASLDFIDFFLSPEAQKILATPSEAAHLPVNRMVSVDDPHMAQALIALERGTLLSVLPEMQAYWIPMNNALLRAVEEDADPVGVLEQAFVLVSMEVAKMRGE